MKHEAAPRDDTKWQAASSPLSSSSSKPAGPATDPPSTKDGEKPPFFLVSSSATYLTGTKGHHIETLLNEDLSTQTDMLVVGDSSRGPPELFIPPVIVMAVPGNPISIVATCLHTPFFLPGGTWIARAIPLPSEKQRQDRISSVYWTEIVGAQRPMVMCKLINGRATAHLQGMMDTGADVTVIAQSEWPLQWGLQPSGGTIWRIGGSASSQRSSASITIEGPDGHTATVKPFVVPSGFTLWGRDVLTQWGARVEIPPLQPKSDF